MDKVNVNGKDASDVYSFLKARRTLWQHRL